MEHQFYGSYELFQNRNFLEIFARHNSLDVLEKDGLYALMARSRIVGNSYGMVGCPEKTNQNLTWLDKIKSIQGASVKINTMEVCPALKNYLISSEQNGYLYINLEEGPEAIFDKFTRTGRKTVRAGVKKGVFMRLAETEADMNCFYGLLTEISEGGIKFDILQLDLMRDLISAGFAKICLACVESNVIGGYFLLLSDTTITGWNGGISRNYLKHSPGNLFMFECMKWGCGNGYKYLDFGQQSLVDKTPILDFKLSFDPLFKPAFVYQVPLNRFKLWLVTALQAGKKFVAGKK